MNSKINLTEYFEETVENFSGRTAIIDGERTISFKILEEKAKALATRLIAVSNTLNLPIAVYLSKSIESVFSDLAIIYSGNIYVNLDVKTPSERTANIIDLIKPVSIITDNKYITTLLPLTKGDIKIFNLDEPENYSNLDNDLILNRLSGLIDTDPLCIINTSGSTGTPKGVVLNHRSFIDFMIRSQELFNFSDDEIIGSLSPLVFDIYSYELCLLMSKGTTLVIIPDQISAYPAVILNLMKEKKVSFIFWVPTIMVNIANMDLFSHIQLPDLKLVWFAGEVFPTKQFNYWRHKLPHVKFANLYGPIEITLDCTLYVVERELKDEEPVPIGHAYRNTDILILDEFNRRITSRNLEGELCVRGTSLAMGYYNNPEKTAAAFIQNPLNNAYPELIYRTGDIVFINDLGEIVFKGRKDSMIKHLGYRIELSEIEHVIINRLKLVKNGCVVYNSSRKEITLFYEAEREITSAEFRKVIGLYLPRYMVPAVYHRQDLLKRNTNGKIDRLFYNNKIKLLSN